MNNPQKALIIFTLLAVTQPSLSHNVKLIHCNSLAGTKLMENNTTDENTAQVGSFPGPAEHVGMIRTELSRLKVAGIVGFENKMMRGRFWSMKPGGVIGDHCHEDRPAMVYLLRGEVHETKRTKNRDVETKILKAGDNIAEGNGTRHWWINKGTADVTMFAVDFPNTDTESPIPDSDLEPSFPIPRVHTQSGDVQHLVFVKDTEYLDLGKEYPLTPELDGFIVQTRVTNVASGAVVGFENTTGLPAITYVTSGRFAEYRSNLEGSRSMAPNSHSSLPYGVYNVWINTGSANGQLITIEFSQKGE